MLAVSGVKKAHHGRRAPRARKSGAALRNISNRLPTNKWPTKTARPSSKVATISSSSTANSADSRGRARGMSFAKYYKQLKASRLDRAAQAPVPPPSRATPSPTLAGLSRQGIASSIRIGARPKSAPRSRYAISQAGAAETCNKRTTKYSAKTGVVASGAAVKMVSRCVGFGSTTRDAGKGIHASHEMGGSAAVRNTKSGKGRESSPDKESSASQSTTTACTLRFRLCYFIIRICCAIIGAGKGFIKFGKRTRSNDVHSLAWLPADQGESMWP